MQRDKYTGMKERERGKERDRLIKYHNREICWFQCVNRYMSAFCDGDMKSDMKMKILKN